MPKRSGLMTSAEAAICGRVKEFRERLGWSQPLFAFHLDISRDRLQSIEYGRNPLRWDVARRLVEKFQTSELWLASGRGVPQPPCSYSTAIKADSIRDTELFSVVFAKRLQPHISETYLAFQNDFERSGATATLIAPVPSDSDRISEWMLIKEIRRIGGRLSVASRDDLFQSVLVCIQGWLEDGRKKDLKQGLTVFPVKGISNPVMKTLPETIEALMRRAVPLVASRTQREVAEKVGVTPQKLNDWLSGRRAPGGQAALRLLIWVLKEEAEQSNSANVRSAGGAKDPKRKTIK